MPKVTALQVRGAVSLACPKHQNSQNEPRSTSPKDKMNRRQWQSTQERVDELTGKISVKQRDNESIFKKQREAIDKNEG